LLSLCLFSGKVSQNSGLIDDFGVNPDTENQFLV
jgi:hypothetical protein